VGGIEDINENQQCEFKFVSSSIRQSPRDSHGQQNASGPTGKHYDVDAIFATETGRHTSQNVADAFWRAFFFRRVPFNVPVNFCSSAMEDNKLRLASVEEWRTVRQNLEGHALELLQ